MIWRRLLVRSDMPLEKLHQALQLTLNWTDDFQYAFKIHGKTLSTKHANSNGEANEVGLQDFHLYPGERFLYEYNYFSFWEFDVRLEKTLAIDEKKVYPLCIGGNGDAPPENAGGPAAYHHWLEQRWSSENLANDNGGTLAATDWTLSAAGPTPLSGAGGAEANVLPGIYTLGETGPGGYEASAWSCTGGTLNGNEVTLALGDDVSCEITNDDQPGTLIVKKIVVNDNGGSLGVTDFSFSVNGDAAVTFEADGQNDLTLDAGTYSVVETTAPGYTTTYDNCANVVVPNGGSATCTITNDDTPTQLTIINTTQGGDASFVYSRSFGTNFSMTTVGGTVSRTFTVTPGTHSVAETVPSAWTLASATCSDGSPVTAIQVSQGESVTCTFSNVKKGTISIIKNTQGGNGTFAFTGSLGSFNITTTGTAASGTGSRNFNVAAGTYNITQTSRPAGWSLAGATCSDGSPINAINLSIGEVVTCTFTNTKP
jgi:large repetitive protein